MSKRRRKSSRKFKDNHPREVGRFYHAYDSSGGHPSLVYYANPETDTYYIQRFSTKQRKGREKLHFSIDPTSNGEQWLIRRPEAVGYDDMTYKEEYKNYRIHPDDIDIVKSYRKYDFIKKIDERCEPTSSSKHMASSSEIIKAKKQQQSNKNKS